MDQYCKNSIREHYLHIDSRDRDTSQHPNSNEYVIDFQKWSPCHLSNGDIAPKFLQPF